MYLFFSKFFFAFCVLVLCKDLEAAGNQTEFVDKDILDFDKNETILKENALISLLKQQPAAVLVELRSPVLKKVKAVLDEKTATNYPIKSTILATFDTTGLQDVSVYNDTFEFRQAIMDLQPSVFERETFTPTTHVLGDLLQKDLPEGFVLVITTLKPSDEEFASKLIRSLNEKKRQLSVLWAGNYPSDEYFLLKDIAERTGGNFGHITNDINSVESLTEEYLPKSDYEHLSEQIKFPEEQKEMTDEEPPTVFRRAQQNALQKTVAPLIVEVASGSSLEAPPGTPSIIQFIVKNNLNMPLPAVFNAKFNGVIQRVQPTQTLIPPSASVTAIVNLQLPNTPQSLNTVGTLTLAAVAANTITARSALIYLTPQTNTDNYAPKMSHKFVGDCYNYKEPQNCEQGQWSLEATLQDEDSGLLKVLSEPYGLLFQSQFVAGSKTPTTVYYTATCCQPHVVIWAEDLKGNYVKKSFDVFNQNLLAGEIASIVLGVLLVLLILIAIVVAIVLIRRRNQRNLIIPRARSGSR